MRRTTPFLLAATVLALTTTRRASAQFPLDVPQTITGRAPDVSGVGLGEKRPFWSAGSARPFLAATLQAGIIDTQESLAFGYGRPHWEWIGVEGYSSIALQGGTEYGGVRLALPQFELRGGVRYSFDLGQYFLPEHATYSRDDVFRQLGPHQRYLALESELSWGLPFYGGAFFGVLTVDHIENVPNGFYIFEDSLHVVVGPSWYARARGGYLFRFGVAGNLRLGGAVEYIHSFDRDAGTLRVGPVFAVGLTHHLDAAAAFLVVAASHDDLGLTGADYGTIGFRYRWATGDRWPEFP